MASAMTEREAHPQRWELEKALATRLKQAPRELRRTLYSEVYDEMYRSVPNHPGNVQKQSAEIAEAAVQSQLRFVTPYVTPESTFVEIGAGDCALTAAVAKQVRRAIAIEVSAEIASGHAMPSNMELAITDGLTIPVPDGSANVIFSNQVMEHLHPDDAFEQLSNVHRALAANGVYICLTPNRLNGPHDVSSHFDTEPTCFHLKEYTITELTQLMRSVGFKRIGMMISLKVKVVVLPAGLIRPLEYGLSKLPHRWRRSLGLRQPIQQLLGIRLVGHK